MNYIIVILIAIVAFEHFYFMWFEMFAWTTKGKKIFKSFPEDLFEKTKTLAGNQGLYNGFIAAGLVWSLLIKNIEWSAYVALFFLSCVAIAGIYGAFTASKRIFVVQALPAIIAIALVAIQLMRGCTL